MQKKSRLAIASQLSFSLIERLASGALLACRIPDYYDARRGAHAVERLVRSPAFSHYDSPGAENIGHIGKSAFEGADHEYYAQATTNIQAVRAAFAPLQNPMDRFRCELGEICPGGAQLANLGRGPMFVGLVRTFADGAEALPHNDIVQRDVAGAEGVPVGFQFAANIHLSAADQGGELELWDRPITNEEYEALRLPNSYGLDRRALGAPDLSLKPVAGDLILFDSKLPHAVRPARGGIRAAISCFMVGVGADQMIHLYS